MQPEKAPWPDGMNPCFYQRFWSIIGNDVSTAILAILNGSPIRECMNHTYIALIPKKHKPVDVSDFRPISLCNVIYKKS